MSFVQVLLAGGLGNRMFEYAFARGYAERHGLQLRRETCILDKIFDIPEDPPADVANAPNRSAENVHEWDGESGVTILGMGQHQRCLDYYSRAKVREWFRLRPNLEELVRDVPSMELVASVRQGDYAYACNPMVLIDPQSYVDACDQHGLDKHKIYWLHSELHYRVPQIDVELPWMNLNDHEKGKLPGMGARLDFLPDLALMMRAKVVLRSNSTFAWWAATLGDARVFCPNLDGIDAAAGLWDEMRHPQKVPFVEGNHKPMISGMWFCTDLNLKNTE